MDLITDGADEPVLDEPAGDLTWRHPSTLAVASLVLATLSLWGASVFRGPAYTVAFADLSTAISEEAGGTGFLVAGMFLTAAFALLPLLMARHGLRAWVPDDGAWTAHLLRAATVLGATSFVLHLVLAVLAVATDNPLGFATSVFG